MKVYLLLATVFLLVGQSIEAQNNIHISGKVVDASNTKIGLPNVMVVNKSTQQGAFTNANGTFELTINKEDTIVFRAFGYHIRKISVADSVGQNIINLNVLLFKEAYQLKEVTIMESRPADSVMKDIQRLGYNKSDYMMKGSDAFMSPISALYEQFSKKERSKRIVAELINNDNRKSLLKELLFYYYRNNVIDLDPASFDFFIDYSNFNDDLLKSLSSYDLAVYIKSKIALYEYRR